MEVVLNLEPIAVPLKVAASAMGLSVSTFQRQVRNKELPAPRKLSDGRVGWLVSELREHAQKLPVSDLLPPANTGAAKPR